MSTKLRFGVLSTANIGLKKVIPGMQQGEFTTVTAIASRDLAKAREAAAKLGIPTAYGSYEELLADPNIDAIYNPLPLRRCPLSPPRRRPLLNSRWPSRLLLNVPRPRRASRRVRCTWLPRHEHQPPSRR